MKAKPDWRDEAAQETCFSREPIRHRAKLRPMERDDRRRQDEDKHQPPMIKPRNPFLAILALTLALLTSGAYAATVIGNCLESGGAAKTNTVVFYPRSTPFFVSGSLITSEPVVVYSSLNGDYSATLAVGDYRVIINNRERFEISVPDGFGTYPINSLVTTAMTYQYKFPPATSSTLSGMMDVEGANSATPGQALVRLPNGNWGPGSVVGSGSGDFLKDGSVPMTGHLNLGETNDIVGVRQFSVETVNANSLNLGTPIAGTSISFADPDANFAATTLSAAISELDNVNGSGPNASDAKVDWSQLGNVPAGILSGSQMTNAYSTIRNAGTAVAARTNLNVTGVGLQATDNAGQNRTDLTLHSRLESYASGGTIPGADIATGISAANITSGTIDDARIPSAVARDTELPGTFAGSGAGLVPAPGSVTGKVLSDNGSWVAVGASPDYAKDITDGGAANIYTNAPPTNSTFMLSAKVLAAGSTNRAVWHKTVGGWRGEGAPTLFTADTPFFGSTSTAQLNTSNLLWKISGNTVVLEGWGVINGNEPTHWQASDIQVFSTTNMLASGGGGGGGATYLVDEGFEGTGAPAGWTSAGTVDWDESTVVNYGSQSAELTSASADSYIITPTFANTTTVYVKFAVRFASFGAAGRNLIQVRNGTTTHETLLINSTGALQITGGSATTDTISLDTWVYVWFSYDASTGASTVEWNTADSRTGSGTKYQTASQAGTTDINNIRLYSDFNSTAGPTTFFDRVLVDDAVINSY